MMKAIKQGAPTKWTPSVIIGVLVGGFIIL